MFEEQNAAAEKLALANRLERAGRSETVGIHCDFHIASLDFLHTATQHDSALINEHQVGKNVLDLIHLVGRDQNGAAMVEVIVKQRIVELLAIENVEAERRLVEHQKASIDRHDEREMELRDHALRQLADFAPALDGRFGEKSFGLGAIEAGVHPGQVVERIRNPQPARQNGDVGNKADIAHQAVALGPWIAAQHPQFALVLNQAEDGIEGGGLAGAVGTDQSKNAAFFDAQAHAVECDRLAEDLAQATCFDNAHDFFSSSRGLVGRGLDDKSVDSDEADWRAASNSSSGVRPSRSMVA